jgi:NADPH:quinone reductase
MWRQCLG